MFNMGDWYKKEDRVGHPVKNRLDWTGSGWLVPCSRGDQKPCIPFHTGGKKWIQLQIMFVMLRLFVWLLLINPTWASDFPIQVS